MPKEVRIILSDSEYAEITVLKGSLTWREVIFRAFKLKPKPRGPRGRPNKCTLIKGEGEFKQLRARLPTSMDDKE